MDGVDTSVSYSSNYADYNSGYTDISDNNNLLSFTDDTNDFSFHIAFGFIWDDKTGTQYLISKRAGATNNREWQIGVSSGFFGIMLLDNSTGANIRLSIDPSLITIGTPYTVQFSYNGSKSYLGLKAYLNKIEIGTPLIDGVYLGMTKTTNDVRIGARYDGVQNFKGKIQDMTIWKGRTMSRREIEDIHRRISNNINII